MVFRPIYANYCENCDKSWSVLFSASVIDTSELNYCPICGNETQAPNNGDMP